MHHSHYLITLVSLLLSISTLAQSSDDCTRTISDEKTFGAKIKFAYPCEMTEVPVENALCMIMKFDSDKMMATSVILNVYANKEDSISISQLGFSKYFGAVEDRVTPSTTISIKENRLVEIKGAQAGEEIYEYIRELNGDTAFSKVVRYTIPYQGKLIRLSYQVATPVASREQVNSYFAKLLPRFKEWAEQFELIQ